MIVWSAPIFIDAAAIGWKFHVRGRPHASTAFMADSMVFAIRMYATCLHLWCRPLSKLLRL